MHLPPRLQHTIDVVHDVREEADRDNVVIVAAGVAFYAVLALIPMMLLAVSLYGLFTTVEEAERQVEALLEVLPQSTVEVLEAQIFAVAESRGSALSFGFLLSVVLLVWTVSNATRALVKAVKIAYDQEDQTSVLEKRWVAMALTLGVVIAMIIALATIAALPILLAAVDGGHPLVSFSMLRWILIGGAVALGIAALYRYAPPMRPDGWRSVVPGTIFASIMWVVVSVGFSVYVASFGNYNETYGTLGAAVILLLWFWLSALAVILGAEVNEAVILRPYRPNGAEGAGTPSEAVDRRVNEPAPER